MPRLSSWLNWKSVVRWLVVAIGALVGFFGLLALDRFNISHLEIDQERYAFTGFLLLSLSWFIASLVAIRNQRLAARILLVTAPPITFCLTSIDANPSGTVAGRFIPVPSLGSCVVLVLCFVPLYLPLFARSWRRALILFSVSALIVAACLALPPLRLISRFLLPTLASASIFFSVLGYFWFAAYKLNWPPLLQPKSSQSPARLIAKFSMALIAFLLFYAICQIAIFLLVVQPMLDECKGPLLFSEPVNPRHSVFTVRVIYVHPRFKNDQSAPTALAVVEHNFWGAPRWPWHLVLIKGSVSFEKGKIYLFDGERSQGLLTRFLPFEDARLCGWTAPIQMASLELGLLNHPSKPPIILGEVYRYEANGLTHRQSPYAGAKVIVTGSSGSTSATTDSKGIFEVDGLPPADYTLSVDLPNTQYTAPYDIPRETLRSSQVVEPFFFVVWNGSLEGRVTDVAGKPAQVWLELRKTNGNGVAYYLGSHFFPQMSLSADSHGFFHSEHISEGDYKIAINPAGPHNNPLYSSTFSTPIHLAPAQHLSHLRLHATLEKR
jgi:hypothetical protein